jgi:hypothetical protein
VQSAKLKQLLGKIKTSWLTPIAPWFMEDYI